MKKSTSRWDERIERAESFWTFLVRRRRRSIQKSLVRPLYQEVLKTLFFVGVLIIDALLPLEVWRDIMYPFNIIGALIILVLLLYGELLIYNKFWGKNGRWSLSKYQQKPKKEEIKKNKQPDG